MRPIATLGTIMAVALVMVAQADESGDGSTSATRDAEHGTHEVFVFGEPGDPKKVDRTLHITALDSRRFSPHALAVVAGETIMFVVHNRGKSRHQFVIGDPETQQAYEAMMQSMADMKHEADLKHAYANALTLEPFETRILYWKFGVHQPLEIACHMPGHYEAGMRILVTVRHK
jgi:uncharacterized cupredoxin-like copper-binding protein